MCWVYEWARALNNLTWAIIHIERARAKTEKRGLKDATVKSKVIIDYLQNFQEELGVLISTYGIKRNPKAPTIRKLARGQRRVRGR